MSETIRTPPPGEEKFASLKALLERAGLSVDEVAPFFEVSRVSIYNWMSDHGPQQPLIRTRALRVIAILERIVASGDLPMIEVPKADRSQVLRVIFKKYVAVPARQPARAED